MQISSQSLASSKKIEALSKNTSSDLSGTIVQTNQDNKPIESKKQLSIVNMSAKPPVRLEKIPDDKIKINGT